MTPFSTKYYYFIKVLTLTVLPLVNSDVFLNNCHKQYASTCTLARRMVEPFRVTNITWDMMKHHKGYFLLINSNLKKLKLLKSKGFFHKAGFMANGSDDQQQLRIVVDEAQLPSILIPLNSYDSSVGESELFHKTPVISFCQKNENIDILWPSVHDLNRYNPTDYIINETHWLSKQDKAWFRGKITFINLITNIT